jgi:hypothetical protein
MATSDPSTHYKTTPLLKGKELGTPKYKILLFLSTSPFLHEGKA